MKKIIPIVILILVLGCSNSVEEVEDNYYTYAVESNDIKLELWKYNIDWSDQSMAALYPINKELFETVDLSKEERSGMGFVGSSKRYFFKFVPKKGDQIKVKKKKA